MSNENYKPYVVSEDIVETMTSWTAKNCLVSPNKNYLGGIRKEIEQVISQKYDLVEIISESEIRAGLEEKIALAEKPVVSLDRVYLGSNNSIFAFLDATRIVDEDLNNLGLGVRQTGSGTLENQISIISASLKQSRANEISLVDDVIFEGKSALRIVDMFAKNGIKVVKVYAAIGVEEGVALLNAEGVETETLRTYQNVIDEVCQRDFVVGAPYSGRTLVSDSNQVFGVPYLYPFGKPVEWASIPEDAAVEFSLAMLAISGDLWRRIERLSGENISPGLIDKPVWGLPPERTISAAINASSIKLRGKGNE